MFHRILALVAALLLAVPSQAQQGPAAPARAQTENDRYVSYFDWIVFGSEFGLSVSAVRKWTEPIRYKLGATPGAGAAAITRGRPIIERHLKVLSDLTLLKFEEIGPTEPGDNFIIWFTTYDKFVSDARMLAANPAEIDRIDLSTANCLFLSYGVEGKLVAGRVIANAQLAAMELDHCLLEELAQSLGLPNDDDRVAPSLFNDSFHLLAPSMIDRVLFRLLYDPRMRPGTPRAQALTLVRQILTELNPGGG